MSTLAAQNYSNAADLIVGSRRDAIRSASIWAITALYSSYVSVRCSLRESIYTPTGVIANE